MRLINVGKKTDREADQAETIDGELWEIRNEKKIECESIVNVDKS